MFDFSHIFSDECSQEKNKKRKNGAQTGEFLPKSKIPTRCNKESKKGMLMNLYILRWARLLLYP